MRKMKYSLLKPKSKALTISLLTIITLALTACSTPKTYALSCQERQIEIYVDDQYLGRDLVYYTPAKGQKYIEIVEVDRLPKELEHVVEELQTRIGKASSI